jgi:hypothetical protein
MKTQKKKYKVCEYNHKPDEYTYVNTESTSPLNGWTTSVPTCQKEFSKLKETPTAIKLFPTKSEAKEYLDVVKKFWNNDWDKNEYIYRRYGYKKPQWKIYEA